jgi:hypothetical protein
MGMMEIPIAPSEHPVIRRWFEGEHLDLIIWETLAGDIMRWRLVTRELNDEVEGFYWTPKEGLKHGHLPAAHNESDWAALKWVSEYRRPSKEFLRAWQQEGVSLPSLVYTFIQKLFIENRIIAN